MSVRLVILLFTLLVSDNIELGTIIPEKEELPPTSLKEPIKSDIKQVWREYMPVCDLKADFASYMDYRAITNSKQFDVQQLAITNEKGYRIYNDRVLIAIHSQYGKVGDELIITFADDTEHRFIIGDIKANTECSHYVNGSRSSLIEIIVDSKLIADRNLGEIRKYSQRVIKIERDNINDR